MKYLITAATEQTATHTGPQGLVRVVELNGSIYQTTIADLSTFPYF